MGGHSSLLEVAAQNDNGRHPLHFVGLVKAKVRCAMLLNGACQCEKVRYEIRAALTSQCFCHCRSCRRASGAPFVAWGTVSVNNFTLARGNLSFYASSEKVQRGFCRHCGSCLTYAHAASPDTVDIALATIDESHLVRPEFHIWLDDKLEWVVINDGLPTYPGWRKPQVGSD
jgi:hypothetical protein